jgi:hypothetical protein
MAHGRISLCPGDESPDEEAPGSNEVIKYVRTPEGCSSLIQETLDEKYANRPSKMLFTRMLP